MDRDALLTAAYDALTGAPGLRALFASGSIGAGTADAWSDIDLLGVAERKDWPAIADALRIGLGPLAMWRVLFGGSLVNTVTPGWERLDLYLIEQDAFARRDPTELKALHDPEDLIAALTAPPGPAPSPSRVAYIAEEFLRILGLTPVVLARGELVTAVDGTGLLRGKIAELMVEEAAPRHRGGALHLSRLIPSADYAALRALPYPGPEREAVIAAQRAHAALFLPRAWALADRIGADWPEALEEATRARLQRELGLEI